MSEVICHQNGRYNIYGTCSDTFIFKESISLEELKADIKNEYGRNGLELLEKRLKRAHKNGHSSLLGETLEEFLSCNRAGKYSEILTYEECLERFLS